MCVLTVARFYFLKCYDSILGNMIRWFKVTCGICKLFPVVKNVTNLFICYVCI